MDFRVLAKFIVVLGLILVGYGVVKIATSQPVAFTPEAQLPSNMANAVENMNRSLRNMQRSSQIGEDNATREKQRKDATTPIVSGLIVTFVGGAVFAAAKKPGRGDRLSR